jgi:hypothetical protein
MTSMTDNVQVLPRFQACGERRAHRAHLVDETDGDGRYRCPGIESPSEQWQHLDEMVHRASRERLIVAALTTDAG